MGIFNSFCLAYDFLPCQRKYMYYVTAMVEERSLVLVMKETESQKKYYFLMSIMLSF